MAIGCPDVASCSAPRPWRASARRKLSSSPNNHSAKPRNLPSLAAQGFEINASLGTSLVLQKGKDVWICDVLTIKSSCDAIE
jgi:hypothetical protein